VKIRSWKASPTVSSSRRKAMSRQYNPRRCEASSR
jgi:hypothetical protein